MAKSAAKNPQIMAKVFCPGKGMELWANSNNKGEFNCTGCGSTHSKLTSKIDLGMLNPTKSKKSRYKKGKKQK